MNKGICVEDLNKGAGIGHYVVKQGDNLRLDFSCLEFGNNYSFYMRTKHFKTHLQSIPRMTKERLLSLEEVNEKLYSHVMAMISE